MCCLVLISTFIQLSVVVRDVPCLCHISISGLCNHQSLYLGSYISVCVLYLSLAMPTDDAVSADIRLETEGEDASDECPTGLSPTTYHPRRALRMALQDWLLEFQRPVSAFGTIQQPQIPTPVPILPSVNTCMSLTSTTLATPCLPQPNINVLADAVQDTAFTPAMNPVMNSLVSENKVVVEVSPEEADSASTVSQDASTTSGVEPMDCNPSPATSPPHTDDTIMMENGEGPKADPSPEDSPTAPQEQDPAPSTTTTTTSTTTVPNKPPLSLPLDEDTEELTVEDLQLLAELFYLPYEHGRYGITIMNEFNWLKINSHLVIDQRQRSEPDTKPEVTTYYCIVTMTFGVTLPAFYLLLT